MLPSKPPVFECDCQYCGNKIERSVKASPLRKYTCFDCKTKRHKEYQKEYVRKNREKIRQKRIAEDRKFFPEYMKPREKYAVDNFKPNGRFCLSCGDELTGMSQKYCNSKCQRNYGQKR
jgi:hypothetical protein